MSASTRIQAAGGRWVIGARRHRPGRRRRRRRRAPPDSESARPRAARRRTLPTGVANVPCGPVRALELRRRLGRRPRPSPAGSTPTATAATAGDVEHRFAAGVGDEAADGAGRPRRRRGGHGRPRRPRRAARRDRAPPARPRRRLRLRRARVRSRRPGRRRIYSNTGYEVLADAPRRPPRRCRSPSTSARRCCEPLGLAARRSTAPRPPAPTAPLADVLRLGPGAPRADAGRRRPPSPRRRRCSSPAWPASCPASGRMDPCDWGLGPSCATARRRTGRRRRRSPAHVRPLRRSRARSSGSTPRPASPAPPSPTGPSAHGRSDAWPAFGDAVLAADALVSGRPAHGAHRSAWRRVAGPPGALAAAGLDADRARLTPRRERHERGVGRRRRRRPGEPADPAPACAARPSSPPRCRPRCATRGAARRRRAPATTGSCVRRVAGTPLVRCWPGLTADERQPGGDAGRRPRVRALHATPEPPDLPAAAETPAAAATGRARHRPAVRRARAGAPSSPTSTRASWPTPIGWVRTLRRRSIRSRRRRSCTATCTSRTCCGTASR